VVSVRTVIDELFDLGLDHLSDAVEYIGFSGRESIHEVLVSEDESRTRTAHTAG